MAAELLHFTLILVITTALVMLLNLFNQPPIISYILAGLIAGPAVLGWTGSAEFIQVFSSLGIAFLLFVVGLDLDFRALKDLGVVAGLAGVAQVLITGALAFVAGHLLGFPLLETVYLGIALTFSSTIIVVKLLSDKKDLESLYGKIAIGVLLVQDIIAVLALLFIGTLATGEGSVAAALGGALLRGLLIGILAWGVNVYILPSLLKGAGKQHEVLFLFSLAWCFGFAVLFDIVGFTIEIGAFIAGVMLASTPYRYEISSRVKPLRDFFIIIFFILLGAEMQVGALPELVVPALALSALIIVGKPVITMVVMGLLGFSKRVSFLTSGTLAQISEFSLIIAALAASVGHVTGRLQSLLTLIALVTFVTSTYFSAHAQGMYELWGKHLPYYRVGVHEQEHRGGKHKEPHDIIVFGHNRIGYSVVEHFLEHERDFLVVDHNPEVVLDLQEEGHDAIFGDADDVELYDELLLSEAKLVISTIPDAQTNQLILDRARKENPDVLTILTARQADDALVLYEAGADYVIIPSIVGGEHASSLLDVLFSDSEEFLGKKEDHIEQLKDRR